MAGEYDGQANSGSWQCEKFRMSCKLYLTLLSIVYRKFNSRLKGPRHILNTLRRSLYLFSSCVFFLFFLTNLGNPSYLAFPNPADIKDLIPPVPVLTRYKKEAGIKAFVKKEILDQRHPDERKSSEINVLPTATLCVQLNTLHVSIRTSYVSLSSSLHWKFKLYFPNTVADIACASLQFVV
ncbi:hypothetical protein Dimus_037630 [Dionaea muscipula]